MIGLGAGAGAGAALTGLYLTGAHGSRCGPRSRHGHRPGVRLYRTRISVTRAHQHRGCRALAHALTQNVVSIKLREAATQLAAYLVGSLNSVNWFDVLVTGIALAVTVPLALLIGRDVSLPEMGDETAAGVGVDPHRTRTIAIVLSVWPPVLLWLQPGRPLWGAHRSADRPPPHPDVRGAGRHVHADRRPDLDAR